MIRRTDIASYLAEQRELAGKASKYIKDFPIFDFHHVPEEPLVREECKTLIDELVRFEISGIPTHQAIIGSRGSGKTLTVKYLQRVIAEHTDLDLVYANCRHHSTTYKILAHLVGVQPRGPSQPELFARFCRQCRRKTVVALDEIDLMSPKDRRRDILYLLSRSEQPFMVIMLSNSPHVLKELMRPPEAAFNQSRSTFGTITPSRSPRFSAPELNEGCTNTMRPSSRRSPP